MRGRRRKVFKWILWEMYRPIAYRKRRYPKAARKKRVLKKWINRFGKDFDLTELDNNKNPFMDLLKKESDYGGRYIPIPVVYKNSET